MKDYRDLRRAAISGDRPKPVTPEVLFIAPLIIARNLDAVHGHCEERSDEAISYFIRVYNDGKIFRRKNLKEENMELTLKEIAEKLGGKVIGDAAVVVTGVSSIEAGRPGTAVRADNRRALKEAEAGGAAAVVCGENIDSSAKPLVRVSRPKAAFARLTALFHPPRAVAPGVSPRSEVSPKARVSPGATVAPFAVIEEGAEVGEGAVIGGGSFIGRGSAVGEGTRIFPNVTILENVRIGKNCLIQSGSVLGGEGFGFAEDADGKQVKIPQLGGVVVEDDVEIGCNVTVDRATWGDTVIRRGVKIDNLVQIAHNDDIGENTVIAGLSAIAGSVKVGKNVVMGGNVVVGDHAEIGDRAILGGRTGIAAKKKIKSGEILLGSPARPFQEMKRIWAWERRLGRKLSRESGTVSEDEKPTGSGD